MKHQRKSSVPIINKMKPPEPVGYVLEDLYADLADVVKKYPRATVHACIGSSGGPMPRVHLSIFYKNGIKGKPNFILETDDIERPQPSPKDFKIVRK